MHLGVTLNDTILETYVLKNFKLIVRNYVTDSLIVKRSLMNLLDRRNNIMNQFNVLV